MFIYIKKSTMLITQDVIHYMGVVKIDKAVIASDVTSVTLSHTIHTPNT